MFRTLKEWTLRLLLVGLSSIGALLLAEVALRVVAPINDGRSNVTLDGTPIAAWFEPGSIYRQVSNEYDARTSITRHGHRVPGVEGNPEVVFVGDSFTYGWGLNDDEVFASIYCAERQRACANLGTPGTGTFKQLNRLEEYLDRWGWAPAEVKLFFFGMSGSFSAGNDFVDNYDEGRWIYAPPQERQRQDARASEVGLAERVIGWQTFLLSRSNLVRTAKYHWGPLLKSMVVADPGQERMTASLEYTRRGLQRLDDLSRRVGFRYSIYLLVPVQDIIRGTHGDTLATLNAVSPKPAIATAQLFTESPAEFYYAYDGHLNAKGSRRLAAYLVSLDTDSRATK